MESNSIVGMLLILILFLMLVIPNIISANYFEKEKNEYRDKWNRWDNIKKNITLLQEIFFYFGVPKNY